MYRPTQAESVCTFHAGNSRQIITTLASIAVVAVAACVVACLQQTITRKQSRRLCRERDARLPIICVAMETPLCAATSIIDNATRVLYNYAFTQRPGFFNERNETFKSRALLTDRLTVRVSFSSPITRRFVVTFRRGSLFPPQP